MKIAFCEDILLIELETVNRGSDAEIENKYHCRNNIGSISHFLSN
jgi:hypothetical protein